MADPVKVAKEVGDVVQSPAIDQASVGKECAVVVAILDNLTQLAKKTASVVESPPIAEASVGKMVAAVVGIPGTGTKVNIDILG